MTIQNCVTFREKGKIKTWKLHCQALTNYNGIIGIYGSTLQDYK